MQLAMPETKDSNASLHHEGILRPVVLHSFLLAMVKGVVLGWIAVPVVTVELNHDVQRGQKRIDAEFPVDHVLPLESHSKAVEHGVAQALATRQLQTLLPIVHDSKLSIFGGIGVAALERAVPNVVRLGARRGPAESPAAYLTNVGALVPTLVLISAGFRAKVRRFHSGWWPVDGLTALGTRHLAAAASTSRTRRPCASLRAVPPRRREAPCFNLAAATANNCANSVFRRTHIKNSLSSQQP